VPIGLESTAESLRSKPEKKEKTAHPTTNNVNVTDMEEEAANSLAVQELESREAQEEKQIESMAASLQKVSAQIEMSRPGPQIVANNR